MIIPPATLQKIDKQVRLLDSSYHHVVIELSAADKVWQRPVIKSELTVAANVQKRTGQSFAPTTGEQAVLLGRHRVQESAPFAYVQEQSATLRRLQEQRGLDQINGEPVGKDLDDFDREQLSDNRAAIRESTERLQAAIDLLVKAGQQLSYSLADYLEPGGLTERTVARALGSLIVAAPKNLQIRTARTALPVLVQARDDLRSVATDLALDLVVETTDDKALAALHSLRTTDERSRDESVERILGRSTALRRSALHLGPVELGTVARPAAMLIIDTPLERGSNLVRCEQALGWGTTVVPTGVFQEVDLASVIATATERRDWPSEDLASPKGNHLFTLERRRNGLYRSDFLPRAHAAVAGAPEAASMFAKAGDRYVELLGAQVGIANERSMADTVLARHQETEAQQSATKQGPVQRLMRGLGLGH